MQIKILPNKHFDYLGVQSLSPIPPHIYELFAMGQCVSSGINEVLPLILNPQCGSFALDALLRDRKTLGNRTNKLQSAPLTTIKMYGTAAESL